MKIVIYYGGNTHGDSRDYGLLKDLLEFTWIEMERVPQVGEELTLYLDNYRVEAKVVAVFPHYCSKGNKYVKQDLWGEHYGIMLDDAEIVEDMKR